MKSMFDIYKETDLLIEALKKAKYEKYGNDIKEAKLSGSMATEILGLILEELKRHDKEIDKSDVTLIKRVKEIEKEINKVLKLT